MSVLVLQTASVNHVVPDAVLEPIRAMVASGAYLDDIPGPTSQRSPDSWNALNARPLRRIYRRGSADHRQARAAGLTEPLPPLAPATQFAVDEAEDALGGHMPSLLRRLFLEIGNGGFGPGCGIPGLRDGHHDDTGKTALDLYQQARQKTDWSFLPDSLWPLCHWGCAIYTFADCSQPDGPIWAWDQPWTS